MMSAGTVAWLPHHGGRNHENTEYIYAYCDDYRYDQRDPGDHREVPVSALPDCVCRVRPTDGGPKTRRRS